MPVNAHSFHDPKQGAPIAGPRRAIAAEVLAGRDWKTVISSDGVVCEVVRLRPRALVDIRIRRDGHARHDEVMS